MRKKKVKKAAKTIKVSDNQLKALASNYNGDEKWLALP